MIDEAMWIITVASVVGTVANIYKRRWCFGVWAVTNATWVVYDVWKGAHAQAAMMAIYFGLAIWGLIQWKADSKEGEGE